MTEQAAKACKITQSSKLLWSEYTNDDLWNSEKENNHHQNINCHSTTFFHFLACPYDDDDQLLAG